MVQNCVEKGGGWFQGSLQSTEAKKLCFLKYLFVHMFCPAANRSETSSALWSGHWTSTPWQQVLTECPSRRLGWFNPCCIILDLLARHGFDTQIAVKMHQENSMPPKKSTPVLSQRISSHPLQNQNLGFKIQALAKPIYSKRVGRGQNAVA